MIAPSSFNPAGTRALRQNWSLIATGGSPPPVVFNNSLSLSSPSSGTIPNNLTSLRAWDASKLCWYFWAPSLLNAGTLTSYLDSKGYLEFSLMPGASVGTLAPVPGFGSIGHKFSH